MRKEATLANVTIVVIEDDAEIRDDLGDLLRGQGFHVEEVASVAEACRFIDRNAKSPLILIDPFLSNFDVNEIRALSQRSIATLAIPVVLQSARDLHGAVHQRRVPMHYGVLLEAVRNELRRVSTVSGMRSGRPGDENRSSSKAAPGNPGRRVIPLLERMKRSLRHTPPTETTPGLSA